MNVLFTSVGRRSYLLEYFREVIGDGEIHAANSTAISPAFQVADKWTVSPLIYDEDYIPFLMDYCKKNKIDIIISLLDIDLMILAKNKKQFLEIGVKAIVSDEKVIGICNDKWRTYTFLTENRFQAPKTYTDLNEAIVQLKNGAISYPVIIKPRWGLGSISVYKADNEQELEILYNKTKREIFDTYLKYESKEEQDACVLIQQMLPGQEFGLDVINDLEGNYQTTIIKKKVAMRSGETDCAETIKDKKIEAIGGELSKALGHIANLDVDVFVDGDHVYILEMNARFGGGYPFGHIAGVNLPKAIVEWAEGKQASKECFDYREMIAQKDIRIIELER